MKLCLLSVIVFSNVFSSTTGNPIEKAWLEKINQHPQTQALLKKITPEKPLPAKYIFFAISNPLPAKCKSLKFTVTPTKPCTEFKTFTFIYSSSGRSIMPFKLKQQHNKGDRLLIIGIYSRANNTRLGDLKKSITLKID